MRRNNKGNYIIFALLCLIALNLGILAIGIYNNIDAGLIKESLSRFSMKTILNEILHNNTNPTVAEGTNLIQEKNTDNYEDYEELEDYHLQEDYIIIDKLDEYESLIIIRDSGGISSVENIPEPLNIEKINVDKSKPYILLYHTHASEGYQPLEKGVYHTPDKNKNVISIGETISAVLEAKGHKIDHVQTYHDLPSYNQSYSRSLNTINKKKQEEPNLKVFFDIHRDGVDDDSPNLNNFIEKSKIKIDGKEMATFSLVVGVDTPNYDEALSFAKYIKAVSDTLYPDLCTGIVIKPYGKYNLYASNSAALIEVGGNHNTIEEAKETAKLIGEILNLVINSIIQ